MSGNTCIWLLPDDAAKLLGFLFEDEKQFKKGSELDCSRYFERGTFHSEIAPFNSFVYVSVLKVAPVGWRACANARVMLLEFINICSHLSNTKNWRSTNGVIICDFVTCTGNTFNPRNIRQAFSDKLLYFSERVL